MSTKIRGLVPQIPTTNTSAPSIISTTTCHGSGKAHKAGSTKKYKTFRCTATWERGKSRVWARALPGGQVLRQQHRAERLPRGRSRFRRSQDLHHRVGTPTADPNRCALSATEATFIRAMQEVFNNPNWQPGNVACKGSNLKRTCTFQQLGVYGVYYTSKIAFALKSGAWAATVGTTGGTAASTCTVLPKAGTAAGKPSKWTNRTDPNVLMTETTVSAVSPPPTATEGRDGAAARPRRPLREVLPRGASAVAVVAVSAALVVADFAHFGVTGWAFIGLVLCPVIVLLTAIDLEHRLLPNVIVLPASLAVIAVVAVSQPHDLVTHIAAGVALGGFFFASAMFFPGSIGFGDVKLGLLIGLALGSQTFPAVEIALLCVLVVALWIVATQGAAARKKAIAFGPFLALGAMLGFFLG